MSNEDNRILKYNHGEKSFKASFMIYVDLEWLDDCNGTRTHNHLVCKRTLSHLAKLAK